ncbi:MAG: PhoH family protein [Planctomycetales bacterium]|nr:PhoH family protein [Planctomycetales bacterium]
MIEATISLVDNGNALSLFGTRDQHLRRISDALHVSITHREGKIHVAGEQREVLQATEALTQLKNLVERGNAVAEDDVTRVLDSVTGVNSPSFKPIQVVATGRKVVAKTVGQQAYVDAIRDHSLVFAIGPAGTGKTYLAVAMAVEAFRNQEIRKIVLVRPAVEAGESLGFLPGDLHAKINPYLRPLLDALYEMMDYDLVKQHMERDTIEVVPLAYMRGRTLNDAFIILDEAQNTTVAQMKMFLTRMGHGSKIVVAGDKTQVDLPPHTRSGLSDALTRLRNIEGVYQVQLRESDIVRHRLVQDIVRAYEDGPKKKH